MVRLLISMMSLPVGIGGHPSTLHSARASVLKRMRHHFAHQVRQCLASKLGKRNPARTVWRAGAHWYLRNVNHQIERKMREYVRHHPRDAPPACARKLRRFVERVRLVEIMRPGARGHLG